MEELLDLKELIQSGNIAEAFLLIEDLEEMGKKGIANNIRSFAKVLLLHLIKQQIELRTTKSWDVSISNSVEQIKYINQRPKGKGNYLDDKELYDAIASSWNSAVRQASLEAFAGTYEARQIEEMINKQELVEKAHAMVK